MLKWYKGYDKTELKNILGVITWECLEFKFDEVRLKKKRQGEIVCGSQTELWIATAGSVIMIVTSQQKTLKDYVNFWMGMIGRYRHLYNGTTYRTPTGFLKFPLCSYECCVCVTVPLNFRQRRETHVNSSSVKRAIVQQASWVSGLKVNHRSPFSD